jgi:hypothetical protein
MVTMASWSAVSAGFALALSLSLKPALAQGTIPPDGAQIVNPVIGGRTVSCTAANGRPVITVSVHRLPDAGYAAIAAGMSVILLNPLVLIKQQPGRLAVDLDRRADPVVTGI